LKLPKRKDLGLSGLLASLGRNKSLKLLSLFLAVALWLAVGGEERTETNLNISLELLNLPPNLMVTSEVPSSIQVRVSGPRGLIRTLAQGRLTHTLDLAGIKAGRQTFPLGIGSFEFPRGIQVTRVQPNPLVLVFTPAVSRNLPIQLTCVGSLPEGLEIKGIKVSPAQIKVKGPVSELDDLKCLPTVPVDLAGLTHSTTVTTDLNFTDLHISRLDQGPIRAAIEIGPKSMPRTFENVPVTPQPLAARVFPPRVSVAVKGPWPQVKSLEAKDLKAWVATGGLPGGRHRLKVQVKLPEGLTLESVTPATLLAHLDKK
jgi:YbbR domain-containing protein